MKTIKIKLSDVEFTRYCNYMQQYLMSTIRPFVFQDIDGKFYIVHHGSLNEELAGGYTCKMLREYAETHSNINGRELNLLCCYGASVTPSDNITIVNNTNYVLIVDDWDDNNKEAIFKMLENDGDLVELEEGLIESGFGDNISEMRKQYKKA